MTPPPASGTILVAWELGGGLGHLLRMLPLVERFRQRGRRVSLAVRDVSRVARIFAGHDVACYQAPVRTTRPDNGVETPRSFAHILHNNGYGDYDELRGLAGAWRNLYAAVRPDLLICDHSPTALLGAAGMGFPVVTLGTGFCCLPDAEPLPDFRPWLPDATDQLRRDEAAVLERINRLLQSWRHSPLDRLAQLYGRVDECFLATFRELDHYPMRTGARYWGAWPNCGGEAPVWPQGGHGKRVFAYLKQFPALPALLHELKRRGTPTLVYCDRLGTALRGQFESPNLHFVERPVDLAEVGRACDFAILHAGHGATVSMLLAGRPVLQVPLNLEQTLTGLATRRIGAGLRVDSTKPAQFADGLNKLIASEQFEEGARKFAARYVDFDPQRQLDRLADRVDQLLVMGGDHRKTGNYQGSADSGCPSGGAPPSVNARDVKGRTILVGIGTGRCGTQSLATLLNHQPSTGVSHEARPLLPWRPAAAPHSMGARFQALLACYPQVARVGDVAAFYLPYVEQILDTFEDVRIVCLQRNRDETIESFLRWTVESRGGRAVNHWAADREGLDADVWDACFPKYPTRDMVEAIGRYWDEYYSRAAELARRFPDRVRIFPTEHALNEPDGIRALLDWIGVPRPQQKIRAVPTHGTRQTATLPQ